MKLRIFSFTGIIYKLPLIITLGQVILA